MIPPRSKAALDEAIRLTFGSVTTPPCNLAENWLVKLRQRMSPVIGIVR